MLKLGLAHFLALAALAFTFVFTAGNWVTAVDVAANWGWWGNLIGGGIAAILMVIMALVAVIGGGAASAACATSAAGKATAGLFGALGGAIFSIIVAALLSISLVLNWIGYNNLDAWAKSGLEDDGKRNMAFVCLGVTLLFALVSGPISTGSSKSKD